jgi:hypothetical protein
VYPAQALSRILAVQPVLDAIERDQAAPRAAFEHLAIGQSLAGQVKSQTKGVALVEIEGQTVAMRLPHQAAPGDTLRLRFAGHMPQPVFLLETPEPASSDGPQLSQTARMLSELVQRLPERNTLPTLTPPAPLLDQPTAQPAEMALALRTALVRSGLFYESHLANWAVGRDSLDGLMQEPQNRLAAAEAARVAASPAGTLALAEGAGAEPRPLNPMHALLSQQLQVLESPQFVWRGELWPGQMLEWLVRKETRDGHDGSAAAQADEMEAVWQSRIRVALPQLGEVTLHIRLDARQGFDIRVEPEDADTETRLRAHRGELLEQLAAAGCTLQTLTVQHADA